MGRKSAVFLKKTQTHSEATQTKTQTNSAPDSASNSSEGIDFKAELFSESSQAGSFPDCVEFVLRLFCVFFANSWIRGLCWRDQVISLNPPPSSNQPQQLPTASQSEPIGSPLLSMDVSTSEFSFFLGHGTPAKPHNPLPSNTHYCVLCVCQFLDGNMGAVDNDFLAGPSESGIAFEHAVCLRDFAQGSEVAFQMARHLGHAHVCGFVVPFYFLRYEAPLHALQFAELIRIPQPNQPTGKSSCEFQLHFPSGWGSSSRFHLLTLGMSQN